MDIDIEHLGIQAVDDIPSLQAFVHEAAVALLKKTIAAGDLLYDEVHELDKIKKPDPLEQSLIKSHIIGSHTKHLAILCRDVLFETQKAIFLEKEGKVTPDALNLLVDQSKSTMGKAFAAYESATLPAELDKLDARELVKQDHPWPIYKEQLEEIQRHLEEIKANESILSALSTSLLQIKDAISGGMQDVKARFEDLMTQATAIINQGNSEHIVEVMDLLNGINQNLDQQGLVALTHTKIEQTVHEAPVKSNPKVGINGGVLLEEDLTPQYQIEQWYDIEIHPMVEDAYQYLDTLTYNFRLALINITNRLELLQNKSSGFQLADHLQPLLRFQEDAIVIRKSIDEVDQNIAARIESELSLAPLMDENETFLSLGFQGSINRFRKEQNLLIERVKFYWGMLKEKYFSIKSTVQEESRLGDVEKVIRYIRGAGVDQRNVHYNNFFNAKVTMVEAFWIGRDLEQKRITAVIDAWNNGFQGAILLKGDRFSGKSSLGDWIGQQHFRGKSYTLKPGRAIMISNKRVELGNDLIGGIESFIERVQYAKPLIWIDDLELWFNEEHPSDQVTERLLTLINEYSRKVFFAVSIGTWTHQRLSKLFPLDYTFQAIIPLSPFSKDLVKDAILLRHGASHKTLVGEDGQELSSLEFDRNVGNIARLADGNIGHALQLWINGVRFKDEQHVEVRDLVKYKFPDIIKSDNGILLTTLLIYRKLKEEELANMLGPAYQERYKLQISRLVGYGIIKKAFNGTLSLNDKVLPALTHLLRQNKFI